MSELDVSMCPVFPKEKFSMARPEIEEHLKKAAPGDISGKIIIIFISHTTQAAYGHLHCVI